MTEYIDSTINFDLAPGHQELIVKRSQDIPDWWIDENKREKAESVNRPTGNFHRFARIPEEVYHQWMREGFDPVKESPAKVIAKLSQEGLDNFITTGKRL